MLAATVLRRSIRSARTSAHETFHAMPWGRLCAAKPTCASDRAFCPPTGKPLRRSTTESTRKLAHVSRPIYVCTRTETKGLRQSRPRHGRLGVARATDASWNSRQIGPQRAMESSQPFSSPKLSGSNTKINHTSPPCCRHERWPKTAFPEVLMGMVLECRPSRSHSAVVYPSHPSGRNQSRRRHLAETQRAHYTHEHSHALCACALRTAEL